MIATSHPTATQVGLQILSEGGTAADAAIAAAAVLCIVEPQMTGIGGDCFWIHAAADASVSAYNGSGRTPAAATSDYFAERGIASLDPTDPHTVTIPGAVDAWLRLHSEHGRLPMGRLLAPSVKLAEEGCVVQPRVAFDWNHFRGRLESREAARVALLPTGRAPTAGERYANPALGRTLRAIGKEGRGAFYDGAIAESLVRTLRSVGGLHTAGDFTAHYGEMVEPIRTRYRGMDVLECPPNGQGITALMILNVLTATGADIKALSTADRIHLFAEATKYAYWERNTWCCDPDFRSHPLDRLLSNEHAASLAALIDPARAAEGPPPDRTEHTDTIYLCAVDRDLNCISFINSLFNAFGSGIFDPQTGVLLHNRGLGFSFAERHPNKMEARKRPMHTIIPGMIFDPGGRPAMSFGVMGGHFQAAGHAQFISHIFDRGLDPQEAAEEPRTFAFDGKLQFEVSISSEALAELGDRGHCLSRADIPIGGAQAVLIDHQRGVLVGGSDPRKDGLALGL